MNALPGVVSVGGTSRLPLGSTGLTSAISVEGSGTPVAEWPEVQFRRSLGDYFQTMGIPLIKGRIVQRQRHGDVPAGLHHQPDAWPRKLFPGEDPVGRSIRNSQTGPAWTIIGLIGDVKHGALDEESQPEMYVSTYAGLDELALHRDAHQRRRRQHGRSGSRRSSRDRSRSADLLDSCRWTRSRPTRSPSGGSSWCSSALFGVLALTLAAIGVYGVMSLLVSERTQEVGVRLALGANPIDVLRMLVGQAMRLTLLGVASASAMSLALMPLHRQSALRGPAARPADAGRRAAGPDRRRDARRADSRAEGDAGGSGAGAEIRVVTLAQRPARALARLALRYRGSTAWSTVRPSLR